MAQPIVTDIVLASNLDGRLELVAATFDDGYPYEMWHRWERLEGGWSDWESLGAPGGDWPGGYSPAVAQNKTGCLEVVVLGAGTVPYESIVWRAWQHHPGRAWRGWQVFGPPDGQVVASAPALARNSDGRLEQFIVDRGGKVWHCWQNDVGTWSTIWHSLGTLNHATPRTPAVTQNNSGGLELFVTANDDAVWHCWQRSQDGWSDWESLEFLTGHVPISSSPVVVHNKDLRLELFVTVSDGAVWHCWQRSQGGWSDWESLGHPGDEVDEMAVGAHADGRLVLFAITPRPPDETIHFDNELWQREQAVAGGWSDWKLLATPAKDHDLPGDGRIGSPTLALNAEGRLELFSVIRAQTAGLYWLQQTSPSGGQWKSAWVDSQPPQSKELAGAEPLGSNG